MQETHGGDTDTDRAAVWHLPRDGAADVRFEGDRLAFVSSCDAERRTPRWTEISVFRTQAGRLVAWVVGRTTVEGERDRSQVYVCDTKEALQDALARDNGGRLGSLSKDVLGGAGLACVEDVA
jgi:hypothetical protein